MTSLPPFLIYQGKPGQVQDSWLTEFDPEHQSAFFTTSETGWTNHELGREWLIGVFDRFTKAKAPIGRVTIQPPLHCVHESAYPVDGKNTRTRWSIEARKLKSTLESLQAEVELLRYENQGLRETIIREKQRRMRGKALKDYLFDRTDPNSAQVFSPAKVAQARLKKVAIDTQKKEEALQKETKKVQRRQQVAEQKAVALEKRRQREAEMDRKRQMKEARRQEKEIDRQIRQETKARKTGGF
ncbi:hypothetical protein B0I35DRAFT_414507 [Stachybotrys elegans]|uniref:DDE-1 domain-containing protein n=1 Tax=Stachybotrys elegans TaxID=80388 RepID=A0A8K0WKC6_9HYPO|nr:hypothetical protein B0I35DRAFT_414507 [Stachybotrys elegans]